MKNLALDVLRHRVAVSYEAEAENLTSEDIIAEDPRHAAGALNAERRHHSQPTCL